MRRTYMGPGAFGVGVLQDGLTDAALVPEGLRFLRSARGGDQALWARSAASAASTVASSDKRIEAWRLR